METGAAPAQFIDALLSLRGASIPQGLVLQEVPAPPKLAPFSAAVSLVTQGEHGNQPLGHATFVVLYDPSQEDMWGSPFRIVGHVRVQIDEDMSRDPVLTEVTWSDFLSSLTETGATYAAAVGTVTRELSEAFGGLELTASELNIELRCSWTPTSPLGRHLEGWARFVILAAGATTELPLGLEVTDD